MSGIRSLLRSPLTTRRWQTLGHQHKCGWMSPSFQVCECFERVLVIIIQTHTHKSCVSYRAICTLSKSPHSNVWATKSSCTWDVFVDHSLVFFIDIFSRYFLALDKDADVLHLIPLRFFFACLLTWLVDNTVRQYSHAILLLVSFMMFSPLVSSNTDISSLIFVW